jgi:hypothetical protein
VGEGLGVVAEQATCAGVVFLGEQAEVVAHCEQPLEQLCRLVVVSVEGERVG